MAIKLTKGTKASTDAEAPAVLVGQAAPLTWADPRTLILFACIVFAAVVQYQLTGLNHKSATHLAVQTKTAPTTTLPVASGVWQLPSLEQVNGIMPVVQAEAITLLQTKNVTNITVSQHSILCRSATSCTASVEAKMSIKGLGIRHTTLGMQIEAKNGFWAVTHVAWNG
ncbi:hypothetical protein [Ferrimicrobium acidiphilum]|uniref:hypothetical protein n=1 Tax=Ferrimicrobium acidiphilum TaxID=121039 RepID=UPI0023F0CD42|nr:hypothetical protein [Ferrimicrobium acidiphilum]